MLKCTLWVFKGLGVSMASRFSGLWGGKVDVQLTTADARYFFFVSFPLSMTMLIHDDSDDDDHVYLSFDDSFLCLGGFSVYVLGGSVCLENIFKFGWYT